MNRDPAGKSAPAGGFQNLGWYSGFQYYNGSFAPSAGSIHPQSPQVGAGKPVSEEVNRQSAAAQGVPYDQFKSYLEGQNKQFAQPSTNAPSAFTPSSSEANLGDLSAPQDLFDPVNFYESAYASSGIKDIENELATKQQTYNEQVSKIKDNPYLSEATMTGRIKKLDERFQADRQGIEGRIATQKADIETKLNLQLKKLDIQSAASTQALNRFNTLLQAGALQGASGQDVANITRSTGISSSMIQSAINAQNKKNNPVSVSTFTAENGEVFAVALDANGNMINKQSLGVIGNVQGKSGSKSTLTEIKSQFVSDANANYGGSDIFPTLVQQYAPYLSLQDIYRLYATSDPGKYYGKPAEDPSKIQEWYSLSKGK